MRMTDAMISRMELDRSFVPPFPERPEERLPLREALRRARMSVLALFTQRDFINRQMRGRLLGRDLFVCNNPAGVREAFGEHHEAFDRKTAYQRNTLGPLLGDALIVSDGELWARRQRLVSPLLAGSCPSHAAELARRVAIERCARWHAAGPGARLDMLAEMGELATDLTARLLFGEELGRRHGPTIARNVALYQRELPAIDLPGLLGLPKLIGGGAGVAARLGSARVRQVVDEVVAAIAHDEPGRGRGALASELLGAADANGAPLPRPAVRNELIGLFVAGRETMAVTLAWALYLVSQSPRVAAHLQAELAAVVGGRPPQIADLGQLTYTRAVLEETLRLYPPIPLLARVASKTGSVNGMTAKRGSTLVVAPWLVQRNRSVWSLPDHFVPERFDAANNPLRDPYSFLAFSIGPRACPAQDLAMAQMMIVLATLLQTFVIDLAPGHVVTIDARLLVRPGTDLPMSVRWRPAPDALPDDGPPPDFASLTRAIHESHAAAAPDSDDRSGPVRAVRARLGRLAQRSRPARAPAPDEARLAATLERLDPPQGRQNFLKAWRRNEARAVAAHQVLPSLIGDARLLREGIEHRDNARATGRGLVVVTVATSVDDLFVAAVSDDFGDDTIALDGAAAPEPTSALAAMRATLGLPVVANTPQTAGLLAARVRIPGTVLLLHLDAPHEGSIRFPLFGRPFPQAGHASLALRAAREGGGLVLPATLVAEGNGRGRAVLRYHPPLDPTRLDEPALQAALNDVFEAFVREYLQRWRRLGDLAL